MENEPVHTTKPAPVFREERTRQTQSIVRCVGIGRKDFPLITVSQRRQSWCVKIPYALPDSMTLGGVRSRAEVDVTSCLLIIRAGVKESNTTGCQDIAFKIASLGTFNIKNGCILAVLTQQLMFRLKEI